MRKTVIALVALGLLATAAFAGNLVNEPFTYANGNLVPNNPGLPALGPWANYSGTTGDMQVAGGYATGIVNTSAFANDDALPFTGQTTSVPDLRLLQRVHPCFRSHRPPGLLFRGPEG